MNILNLISWVSIALGVICFVVILADILLGDKQQMMIMNFVYPISALYAGPLALLFYYLIGKKGIAYNDMKMNGMQKDMPMKKSLFGKVWRLVHCIAAVVVR